MPAPLPKLSGTRLLLARILRTGAKAAREISKDADKPTGSFFGVLRRMVEDGLVAIDTTAPTRGTIYALTDDGLAALVAAERAQIVPGELSGGQRLLIVERPDDLTAAQRVLADGEVSGCIAWSAEIDGGWLLALQGDSSYPQQRLEMAFAQGGVAARRLSVSEIIDGGELRARASWMTEDIEELA